MLHIEIINADGDLIVEYDLANNPYKVGELINIQITDYREKPLTYKINKTYTIHKIEHFYNKQYMKDNQMSEVHTVSVEVLEVMK